MGCILCLVLQFHLYRRMKKRTGFLKLWLICMFQIGLLLLESLSLLGYFALFHPENQAVLRWGKSPTILHKVNDL